MLNIVGIDNVKNKLKESGFIIDDVDEMAAEIIFKLTDSCVVKQRTDKDGIIDTTVRAFIRNEKVEQLINNFPNAALLLYFLNSKDNYGFVMENGSVERTGMMGEYNPISAARNMVAGYIGSKWERNHLFNTIDDEKKWEQWVRDNIHTSNPFESIVAYRVSLDEYHSNNKLKVGDFVTNNGKVSSCGK